jgi:hypothetical protein
MPYGRRALQQLGHRVRSDGFHSAGICLVLCACLFHRLLTHCQARKMPLNGWQRLLVSCLLDTESAPLKVPTAVTRFTPLCDSGHKE